MEKQFLPQSSTVFFTLVLLAICLINKPLSLGQVNKSEAKSTKITLKKDYPISKHRFSADIPLGDLPSGAKIAAQVLLKNDTDEVFEFDKANPNCSCTDFSINTNRIESGGTALAVIEFEVPTGNVKNLHSARVDLLKNAESVATLIVNCGIQGGLTVGSAQHVFSLQSGVSEYQVPIYFSDPIKFENLKSELSENAFKGAEVQHSLKLNEAGRAYLSVVTSRQAMEEKFSPGTVVVTDPVSGKSCEAYILLAKQEAVEIAPALLRFREFKDEAGSAFECSAIIRVNVTENYVSDEKQTDGDKLRTTKPVPITVKANFEDSAELKTKVRRMGDSIFRVRLVAPNIEGQETVYWYIKVGNETHEISSKVFQRN